MAKKTIDDIPDMLPLLSDAGGSAADAVNADQGKKKFVTAGERIHKWGTYLSVDWIFNATVGVAFAYWGKFTESGQRMWSGPITKGFTKILSHCMKDEQLERSVGKGNLFMSIIAGGMFTIPPLMVLENSKVKKSIVKFFDKMIYGKDKVENDPKFQQAYEEIKEAPKKDFWTGMTSRFAALAPLLAIVLIPKTQKLSDKYFFNHISKASAKVATKLGFSAEKTFQGVKEVGGKKPWEFVHEGVAMDAGLGIPYAILHAFTYNLFAGFKGKKKPKGEEKAPEQINIPAAPIENTIVADASAPTTKFAEKKDIAATVDASHAASIANRRIEAEAAPTVTV